MDPIQHFPDEINCLILSRLDSSSLLNANAVCKGWQKVIRSHFKEILLSQYSQYFSTTACSNSTLDNHFVVAMDASLTKKIETFVLQLQKDQTGIFSVIFPFNPESKFLVRIGKRQFGHTYNDSCYQGVEKKEYVIFPKKISLAEPGFRETYDMFYCHIKEECVIVSKKIPLAETVSKASHDLLFCYKAILPTKFHRRYENFLDKDSSFTYEGFPELKLMVQKHFESKNKS